MKETRWSRMFHPDNRLFRNLSRITDVVGLSLLFLCISIPLVTIGPASAALYKAVQVGVIGQEDSTYGTFFRSFRQNFLVGSVAGCLLLVLGILLYIGNAAMEVLGATYGGTMVVFQYAYRVLLLLPMGIAAWVFPILSRYEVTVAQLLSRSFLVAIRFLPRTIVLAMLLQETISLCILIFPLVLIAPAVETMLASLFIEPAFRRLTPDDGSDTTSCII